MLYPDFNDLVSLKNRKCGVNLDSSRSVKSTAPGNYHSPFRGQGLEFDSVREYVPGDDIRNIDWRVTARMGSPHLKQFKEDRERQVVVCVDVNTSMRFGTRNTFKSVQAARIAALLGWQCMAHQDRVSSCLFGDVPQGIQFFPPKRTSKSFCEMLKVLSEAPKATNATSLEQIFKYVSRTTHTGSLVYFISDFIDLNENLLNDNHLSKLSRSCDVVFISVNDPLEQSVFPAGMIRFQSNETHTALINTESLSGRKAYALQWEQNRQKLREISSRLKIPVIELSTESDIPKDLSLGLKYIARRRSR